MRMMTSCATWFPLLLVLLVASLWAWAWADAGEAVAADGFSMGKVLAAWSLTENSAGRVGMAGEISEFQLKRSVIKQHDPNNCFNARWIAAKHVEWIRRSLMAHGITPTIPRIALAIKMGLEASIEREPNPFEREYELRFLANYGNLP